MRLYYSILCIFCTLDMYVNELMCLHKLQHIYTAGQIGRYNLNYFNEHLVYIFVCKTTILVEIRHRDYNQPN